MKLLSEFEMRVAEFAMTGSEIAYQEKEKLKRDISSTIQFNQVVTAAEWAAECGVSPQYIRRLCIEGKLKSRLTEQGVWLILKPEGKPYDKIRR